MGRIRDWWQGAGYEGKLLFAHQTRINSTSAPMTTACAELAAGMVGRALAAADIEPQGSHADAATKAWRERVGRDIVMKGESLSLIELRDGQVTLHPATSWVFEFGGRDPETWIVDAQIPTPTGQDSVRRPWSEFVSLLWAPDPARPWRGISPIESAATTANLLGASERSLSLEAAGPVGHLVPVPRTDEQQIADLREELSGINGTSVMVESTITQDARSNTSSEYMPRRLGANPPSASVTLRRDAERSLIAAIGIDVTLLTGGAGNSRRESYRQFLHTTISPIGERLETELGMKLEVPNLRISFQPLSASDAAGKARAVGSLVQAGWTPQEAAEAVGFEPPSSDETPEQEMPQQ